MNHARFEQDCLRFLYSLGPPDRIGQLSPPRGVPWHDLHKVTGKGCSQSPFPGRHVESETRSQDLDAGLVRGRNLIECKRRIVQHSQLDIPARDKDAPLPIRVQGIRDSCTKEKSAFVHFFDDFSCFKLRLYSKSDRLQRKIYARPCGTCFRERQFYCARLRNDSTSHRSRLTPGQHPRRFHLDGKARTGFTFGFARGASEPCSCSSRSTSDPPPKVATRIRRPAPLRRRRPPPRSARGRRRGLDTLRRAGWLEGEARFPRPPWPHDLVGSRRRAHHSKRVRCTSMPHCGERDTVSFIDCAALRRLSIHTSHPNDAALGLLQHLSPLAFWHFGDTDRAFHILADLRKRSEIPFRSLNRQTVVLPSALPDTATARPAIRRANRRPGCGCPTDRGSRTGTAGSV